MAKTNLKNSVIAMAIVLAVVSCGDEGGDTWKWVVDAENITAREDKEETLKQKKENDLWGYVNQNDEWVFEPKFNGTTEFKYGVAEVNLLGHKTYVNTKGEMIVSPNFSMTSPSLGRGAPMTITGINGYTCLSGADIEEIKGFSEGYAAVLSGGKWGYIGKHGTFVISPQFDKADNFINGKARVTYQGKVGYITLRNFED